MFSYTDKRQFGRYYIIMKMLKIRFLNGHSDKIQSVRV